MYPPSVLPQFIAQRGNAAEFPQNTLPALRSALELGANYIGFDVQMTADHIPVLLEDTHIERMAAVDCSALETSWTELSEVALGETQRFGKRFADVGIPSLVQAAQLLAAFPDVRAFVEIRPASLQMFGQDMVVRRVIEALKPVRSQCGAARGALDVLAADRLGASGIFHALCGQGGNICAAVSGVRSPFDSRA
jgi:glycerophosphoryl diester phosphodiesterase